MAAKRGVRRPSGRAGANRVGGAFRATVCTTECCGECITYWKALSCPRRPIAPFDPCGPQTDPPLPDPIYIRADAVCLARTIRPGDTIYVDGNCYTLTNLRFRRIEDSCPYPPLPSGARVVDTAPCFIDGCLNELCRQPFRGWGIATDCDGPMEPPIYFCLALVSSCVYINLHDVTGGPDRCLRLDPLAAQVAPTAGAFVITTLDGVPTYSTCCQCQAQINPIPCIYCRPISSDQQPGGGPPIITEGAPCCYDQRQPCAIRVSGEFESWDAISNGQLYTHTTIPPQVVSCSAGTILYTREIYENGLRVFGPTDELGVAPVWDACNRVVIDYQLGFRSDMAVTQVSTCDETRVTYRIGTPGTNGSTVANFTMTLQPQANQAPCAGRCGSSSLNAGAKYVPVVAVPRKDWPVPVKVLAALANESDKGLGDTAARMITPQVSWLVERAFEAIGRQCGCAARKELLNQMYPYL